MISVVQHVAVFQSVLCCSALQCVPVCGNMLQGGAVRVCVVVRCSVVQCNAECFGVVQCVAVCCSVLQCVAVCCSVVVSVARAHERSHTHTQTYTLSYTHTHFVL